MIEIVPFEAVHFGPLTEIHDGKWPWLPKGRSMEEMGRQIVGHSLSWTFLDDGTVVGLGGFLDTDKPGIAEAYFVASRKLRLRPVSFFRIVYRVIAMVCASGLYDVIEAHVERGSKRNMKFAACLGFQPTGETAVFEGKLHERMTLWRK